MWKFLQVWLGISGVVILAAGIGALVLESNEGLAHWPGYVIVLISSLLFISIICIELYKLYFLSGKQGDTYDKMSLVDIQKELKNRDIKYNSFDQIDHLREVLREDDVQLAIQLQELIKEKNDKK